MSLGSGSGESEEAVVQHAQRARSVRSVRSASVFSFHTNQTMEVKEKAGGQGVRPRLVPFTSSARVPVPKLSEGGDGGEASGSGGGTGKGRKKRVVSQMAKVFRSASTERRYATQAQAQPQEEDVLSQGIEYVRALGDDLRSVSDGSAGKSSFTLRRLCIG